MPRSVLSSLVVAVLVLVGSAPAGAQTCTTTWTNAAGGSWATVSNWSAGVPTAGSTACITLDGTYTVSGPNATISVGTLVLGAASGTQTLTLGRELMLGTGGTIRENGVLQWSAGYLEGASLINEGLVRLTGTANNRGVRGAGAVFRNEGTVEASSTGLFYIYNNGRAENAGLWDVRGGNDIYGFSNPGTFVNEAEATFRKSGGGADATRFVSGGLVVENAGTVEALAGAIQFERPSTHTSATFAVAAGATVVFQSGGVTFEGTTRGAPAGTLRLQNDFSVAAGSVWDVGGTGVEWTAGYLESGALVNEGRVHLAGTSNSRGVRGGTASFRNEGTVKASSTGLFYVYNGARVENASLWDVLGGNDIYGSSNVGTFVNEDGAVFRKRGGGTDVTRFVSGGLVVENAGTISALDGTIRFERPSTHTDALFVVADTAAVVFQSGGVTFEGTTTGTPAGLLQIQNDFTVGQNAVWNVEGTGIDWAAGYLQDGDLTNVQRVHLSGTTNSRGVRNAQARFRNEGTVEWSSTGQFYIYNDARVENASLWDVTSGGDLYGFSNPGTFVNEAEATFRKSGGEADATRLVSGGLSIENAGAFEAQVGTIQFERPSTHTDAAFVVAAGATVVFQSGGVTFEGTTTGAPAGTLRLQNDFAAGAGAVWDVDGTGVEWTAGYLQAGDLINTGRVHLAGGTNSRGVRGAGVSFQNDGTVEWSSTGQFYIYNQGLAENNGLWEVTDEGDLYGFSNVGTFVNTVDGTVRKSGAGTMRLVSGGLVVDNRGTFDVRAGTVQFERPSTHTNANFAVAEDAVLRFNSTPVTFVGAASGEIDGRLLTTSGIVSNDATLVFTGTGLEWAAGYLTSGTLVNTGRVRLTGTSNSRGVREDGAVFRNEGTVEASSTGLFYVYNNGRAENAGLWDVRGGNDIYGFSNPGTFVNEAGATFRKSGGGADATRFVSGGLVVENAGTVDVQTGIVSVERPFVHQEGGVIQGSGQFNVSGSLLQNEGDTAPGASPGVLAWGGVFAPSGTSALQIEIGGDTPGTGYDQLAVTGAARLNGRLVVDVIDGYTPTDGDAYTILTAASVAGGFDLQGLTDPVADVSLYPTFTETAIVLTAASGIPTISGALAVSPNQITNGETAEITLTGTGFAPDVSVRFLCDNCVEPVLFGEVTGLVKSISPTEIVVAFGAVDPGISGLYDVVVTDPRGGEARASIAITPGDLQVVVEAPDAEASESGSQRGTFLVRSNARLAAPLDVRFELSGTATRYLDYTMNANRGFVRIQPGQTTARVAVVPLGDSEIEGDETVVLTLDTDDVEYEVGSQNQATITIADGPPPTAFDVLAVRPRRAGAGLVTLTVSGQSIASGATARLDCGGTVYNAFSATAAPTGTSLRTQFDLTGQAETTCDLTVTSGPDSEVLAGAFDVLEARAPNLTLELISPERRRRGREVRHRIVVSNRGNVDAYMVPVEIAVNAGASIRPEFDVETPQDEPDFDDFPGWDDVDIQRTVNGQTLLPVVIPVVPAGAEIELSFYSDASQVSAAVRTPLLAEYDPTTGAGRLSAEFEASLAGSAQIDGEVALCWTRKLGFAAISALGRGVTSIAGCVKGVAGTIAGIANQALSAYNGTATTLSYTRVGAMAASALVTCLSASTTAIGWTQGLVLAYNLSTAVYDAYHDCPKKPKETETEEVASFDPNDKLGPGGVDIARYFQGEEERLYYTVRFENLATATAPAAEVFVTDTLDTAVYDLSSFALGPVTFGDSTVTPPPGLQTWSTTLDFRPAREMLLQISGSLEAESGLVSWAFTTLDPATNDLPEDPLVGFLPPNQTAPEGEGSVSFAIGLREGLASGTVVENDARIVFDLNEPIDTPVWSNTIDRSAPTSEIQAVGYAAASDTTLVLTVAGSDDASGILDYDVYASRDGGPFELAFTGGGSELLFEGERGSRYSFFSVARDRVGNTEAPKTEGEASTTWPVGRESADASLPETVSLTDPYPNPTSGAAVVQFGLPAPTTVDLRVFDVQGREVARLEGGPREAGWHRLPWDARGLASGVYVVRLQADGETQTRQVVVVR